MSNSLFLQLRGIMGAEENDVTAVVEDAVVVPETVEETVEVVAAGAVAELSAEVEEQGNEVETLVEKLEDIQEDVEELQETVEGAESLLTSGQWNPQAFALLYGKAESLNAKLGGKEISVLGAESLADATTAQLAARDGLEAFGETIKKVGSGAIAFIKRIWDAIVAFVAGLFSKAAKVKSLAKAVGARLDKAEKVKEEIKLGKWNVFVDVEKKGGKSPKPAFKLLADAGAAVAAADTLLASPEKVDSLAKAMANLSFDMGKLDEAFGPGKKAGSSATMSSTYSYRGLSIIARYYGSDIKTFEDVSKAAKAVRFVWAPNASVKTSGDFKVSETKDSLKQRIASAVSVLDTVTEGKNTASLNAKKRDEIIAKLKALDSKESPNKGKAVTAVKSVYGCLSSVVTSTGRLGMAIAEGELSYVRACL